MGASLTQQTQGSFLTIRLSGFFPHGTLWIRFSSLQMKRQEFRTELQRTFHTGSYTHYTVKRVMILPSPVGLSLTNLSLAGNNQTIPGQGEFGIVTSRLGTGISLTYLCRMHAVIVLDLVECSNEVGLGPSRNNRKSRVCLP